MAQSSQKLRGLPLPIVETSLSHLEFGGAGVRKPPTSAVGADPLLNAEEVAKRLKASTDWVWDHFSRKKPYFPVIRMGDGTLRYRLSGIEAFIDERERLSSIGLRRAAR